MTMKILILFVKKIRKKLYVIFRQFLNSFYVLQLKLQIYANIYNSFIDETERYSYFSILNERTFTAGSKHSFYMRRLERIQPGWKRWKSDKGG